MVRKKTNRPKKQVTFNTPFYSKVPASVLRSVITSSTTDSPSSPSWYTIPGLFSSPSSPKSRSGYRKQVRPRKLFKNKSTRRVTLPMDKLLVAAAKGPIGESRVTINPRSTLNSAVRSIKRTRIPIYKTFTR